MNSIPENDYIESNSCEDVSKEYSINVLIKEKIFKIYCGQGKQKLRWLTDNAILRYEILYKTTCGLAYGIKLENGNPCNLQEIICDTLKTNENIWILLKEEYEAHQDEIKTFNK